MENVNTTQKEIYIVDNISNGTLIGNKQSEKRRKE